MAIEDALQMLMNAGLVSPELVQRALTAARAQSVAPPQSFRGGYGQLPTSAQAAATTASYRLGRAGLAQQYSDSLFKRKMDLAQYGQNPFNIVGYLDALARTHTQLPLNNGVLENLKPMLPDVGGPTTLNPDQYTQDFLSDPGADPSDIARVRQMRSQYGDDATNTFLKSLQDQAGGAAPANARGGTQVLRHPVVVMDAVTHQPVATGAEEGPEELSWHPMPGVPRKMGAGRQAQILDMAKQGDGSFAMPHAAGGADLPYDSDMGGSDVAQTSNPSAPDPRLNTPAPPRGDPLTPLVDPFQPSPPRAVDAYGMPATPSPLPARPIQTLPQPLTPMPRTTFPTSLAPTYDPMAPAAVATRMGRLIHLGAPRNIQTLMAAIRMGRQYQGRAVQAHAGGGSDVANASHVIWPWEEQTPAAAMADEDDVVWSHAFGGSMLPNVNTGMSGYGGGLTAGGFGRGPRVGARLMGGRAVGGMRGLRGLAAGGGMGVMGHAAGGFDDASWAAALGDGSQGSTNAQGVYTPDYTARNAALQAAADRDAANAAALGAADPNAPGGGAGSVIANTRYSSSDPNATAGSMGADAARSAQREREQIAANQPRTNSWWGADGHIHTSSYDAPGGGQNANPTDNANALPGTGGQQPAPGATPAPDAAAGGNNAQQAATKLLAGGIENNTLLDPRFVETLKAGRVPGLQYMTKRAWDAMNQELQGAYVSALQSTGWVGQPSDITRQLDQNTPAGYASGRGTIHVLGRKNKAPARMGRKAA